MKYLILGFAVSLSLYSQVSAQDGPPREGYRPEITDPNAPEVRFRAALRAIIHEPVASLPVPKNELFQDITIENLCGSNSINESARRFINEREKTWFTTENRAVALTATISFAEAKNPATATIPLILLVPEGTKASDGTEIVNNINCNPVILGSLPKDQPLTIKLDLKWKSGEFKISDGPLKALKLIGQTLTTAALLGPHTATAGAGILAFSAALGPLTETTNEFLKLFGSQETDIPTLYRWEKTAARLAFMDGKKTRFALLKKFRSSNLNFTASNPASIPSAVATKYGDAASLPETYKATDQDYGAFKADSTPQRFESLCVKLQTAVQTAYGADLPTVAIAVYYFLYDRQASFAPKRLTCLTIPQIALLKTIALAEPYPGAFEPNGPKPADPEPSGGKISEAEWDELKENLEAFARTIKNAPARMATEKERVRTNLAEFFENKVITANWIEGAPPLLPGAERGVPINVLLNHFENWAKWGQISHFGCFGKPTSTVDVAKGVTAETLMLFPERNVMALVQVSKAPKKSLFSALEISTATKDDVNRLIGERASCGKGEDRWDPRPDFKKLYPNVASRAPGESIGLASYAR